MIAATLICAFCTVMFAKNNMKQNSLVEENMRRHTMYKKGEVGGGSRVGLVTNSNEGETKE